MSERTDTKIILACDWCDELFFVQPTDPRASAELTYCDDCTAQNVVMENGESCPECGNLLELEDSDLWYCDECFNYFTGDQLSDY